MTQEKLHKIRQLLINKISDDNERIVVSKMLDKLDKEYWITFEQIVKETKQQDFKETKLHLVVNNIKEKDNDKAT